MLRRRRPDRTSEPPRWSAAWRRPRVLVEHVDPGVRDALVAGLCTRGYDVLACPGPVSGVRRPPVRDEGRACPLLEGEPCPAVDGADVVVTGLADTPAGREIVRRIADDDPDRPLLVEGTSWMLRHLEEDLAGRAVWPLTTATVAARLPVPDATPVNGSQAG